MYQLITRAWVEDGFSVHVSTDTIGDIILSAGDIRQAVQDHKIRHTKKMPAYLILCKTITGKLVDIDAMGGHEASPKKRLKKVREMTNRKTVKIEFVVRRLEGQRNIEVHGWASEKVKEIQEKVMHKDFMGWVDVKPGDGEKADEITLIGNFKKPGSDAQEAELLGKMYPIAEILDGDGFEYVTYQYKD